MTKKPKQTKPIKLITAEEARQMREDALNTFVETDLQKYIKHINGKIREETKRGKFGFELWYEYYCGITPDPVISQLSPSQLNELIKHLEENGYRAYLHGGVLFKVYWNIVEKVPEPEVKEEPKKIPAWWRF